MPFLKLCYCPLSVCPAPHTAMHFVSRAVLVGKGLTSPSQGPLPTQADHVPFHSPATHSAPRAPAAARAPLATNSPSKKTVDTGGGGLESLMLMGQSVGSGAAAGDGGHGSVWVRQREAEAPLQQGHKGRGVSVGEDLRVGLKILGPLHPKGRA